MSVSYCIHTVVLDKLEAFNSGRVYRARHHSQSDFSQILKCSQNFSADTAEIIRLVGFYQCHWNYFGEMNLCFSFKFTFLYF